MWGDVSLWFWFAFFWWLVMPRPCSQPPHKPQSRDSPQYSEWGEKEVGLCQHPHSWGSQMLTHAHVPRGRYCRRGDLSWYGLGLPWGRGGTGKMKLFLLLSPVHLCLAFLFVLFYFARMVCWDLAGLLDFRKLFLPVSGVLWGKEGRKCLFRHLIDVTPHLIT